MWDAATQECVTSIEFVLRTNPEGAGYCTRVGLVSQNKGYDEENRPAPKLRRVAAQRGDC